MPFTHARACDRSTFKIQQKPKPIGSQVVPRTVLILGDAADLEDSQVDWARVWFLLYDRGYNATFTVPTPTPLANKWIASALADPESYPDLLGAADALLGIGTRHIPTTPYIAMCRGTPAVFPTFDHELQNMGNPEGWERFDPSWLQHGQYYVDEPEPYGFKYPGGNNERLAYELWKALSSGKTPQCVASIPS